MDEQGRPNHKGLDFYKRLLDSLAAKNIERYVTLYHWDLPQHLEDKGGWPNRDTASRFAEYADMVSSELSGRVTAWATFNEPWCSAYLGYGNGHHAPGHSHIPLATQAMHHTLLAHGYAVPILRANDAQATVGIVANVGTGYPASDAQADIDAGARLYEAYQNGWVLDPILRGQYPADLWRLWPGAEPVMQAHDMDIIRAPIDFLGLNFYSRAVVRAKGDNDFEWVHLPDVERTQMDREVYPQGLQDIL